MSDSSSPPGPRAKWRMLPKAVPGMLISAALAALFSHEAWSAGTAPEPYGFGSVEMLAQGGREYASATAYVLASLLAVALALASIAFLLRSAFLGNARLMSVGYLCLMASPTVSRQL